MKMLDTAEHDFNLISEKAKKEQPWESLASY